MCTASQTPPPHSHSRDVFSVSHWSFPATTVVKSINALRPAGSLANENGKIHHNSMAVLL